MAADESLGNYQFGRYLVTKQREVEDDEWTQGEPRETTRYKMYREPDAAEKEYHGEDWAPAFEAGTMDILHHPAAENLPRRRWVGNAAATIERHFSPPAPGAEGSGRVVHSAGWHEKYSPRDEVEFLNMERSSKLMMPTMLGLAQNEAKETTGQNLTPSTSLSPHSQRIVSQLKAAGMVSQSHEFSPNQLNFLPAWPVNVPGGLEGHFSNLMSQRHGNDDDEDPIPTETVAAGRETGRDIVRQASPRRSKKAPPAPAPGAPRPRSRAEQTSRVPRSVRDA